MQITKGVIRAAIKCVVYGPEGVGKSTFASQAPGVVFSDIEGSTKQIDVARFPTPSSWAMQLEQARYVRDHGQAACLTYALDTIDFLERLCCQSVCEKFSKSGIEDFGYGNGYTYVYEEFGKFLNLLDEIILRGVNVILNAHATLRKFEQPDESGGYDRWELKLQGKAGKNISAMVKEWADMVLFANYKTMVINVDGQGSAKGKNKVQGGKRVMYTSHHPCWDAKNRYGLPEELPFEFGFVAHCFLNGSASQIPAPVYGVTPPPAPPVYDPQPTQIAPPAASAPPAPPAMVPSEPLTQLPDSTPVPFAPPSVAPPAIPPSTGIPQQLLDLMNERHITEEEIQGVVAAKGFYPLGTPIANYDPGFISGWIMSVWQQIVGMIEATPGRLPF